MIEPGKEKATELTHVTPEQVASAFVGACWLVNMRPTTELIGMLLAHSALETGHWKFMRNYNFGNVKSTGGWIASGGDYCYYEASENLPAKHARWLLSKAEARTDGIAGRDAVDRGRMRDGRWRIWFYPSHDQCRFRSFGSLTCGAGAYVEKLLGRYLSAIAWAHIGSVDKYVRELHSFGYFTAGEAGYRRLMRILFSRYMKIAEMTDISDPSKRQE